MHGENLKLKLHTVMIQNNEVVYSSSKL